MVFIIYFSQGDSPPLSVHEIRTRQRAPITPRSNSRTKKIVPNTVCNTIMYTNCFRRITINTSVVRLDCRRNYCAFIIIFTTKHRK